MTTKRMLGRLIRRGMLVGSIALLGFLGLLAGCQSKLIYFLRPYPPGTVARWQADTNGRTISVTTSQGRQVAYLMGNLSSPRNLWIVCGGNGTVALDWSEWLQTHAPREDAYLLFDFPGYGASEGTPNPARIRESFGKLIPAATASLGWHGKRDGGRLRFFGHSLGAAGVLIAASDAGIRKGVLLAPFTSTMDMAEEITRLPVGFLVYHRFGNHARLAEICADQKARIVILHGSDDEVIPCAMGRALAEKHAGAIRFEEIKGCRHNDLQSAHPAVIAKAMRFVAD